MTGGGSGPFYGLRPKEGEQFGMLYLLGLLNSHVFGFMIKSQSTTMRGGYLKFSKQYIERAPIRTIDFDNPADVARHDRMVALVTEMLSLHERLAAARMPGEKTMLQRRIDALDGRIDALVYELYELTDDEIAIVEEATAAH